jgi:phosphoadenosine phosphosulfate reductase
MMIGDLALQIQIVIDHVERAIARLRNFEPADGYWLAFSGGKDSQCIYHLAQEAGVRFEPHYNVTTMDPPELVRFIRRQYPDVVIDRPQANAWQLIARERTPFTRIARYCCRALKERGGEGRVVVTGVRRTESVRRRNRGVLELATRQKGNRILMADDGDDRRMVEQCPTEGRHILNPIIDWTEAEVWQFIRSRRLPYCSLYDEGFARLGCVACPMKGGRRMRSDLVRWPHFRELYLRAFAVMLDERRRRGMPTTWQTAEQVMAWWTEEQEYPMFDEASSLRG